VLVLEVSSDFMEETYVFECAPHEDDRVGRLEDMVRDRKQENSRLKQELAEVKQAFEQLKRVAGVSRVGSWASGHALGGATAVRNWDRVVIAPHAELGLQDDAAHSRFTCAQGGLYRISVRVTGPTSANPGHVAIKVNGTIRAKTCVGTNTGYTNSFVLVEIVQLNAGQYFEIEQFINSGNTVVDAENSLTVECLARNG